MYTTEIFNSYTLDAAVYAGLFPNPFICEDKTGNKPKQVKTLRSLVRSVNRGAIWGYIDSDTFWVQYPKKKLPK
jgi:hypothetical protein